MADDFVDGNALAGPLAEVLAIDMTTAVATCAGCRWRAPMAEVRVYDKAPGLVGRCANCEQVLVRLVRTPDSAWLDLRGILALRVPL